MSNQPTSDFIAQRPLFKAYDIRGRQGLFTPKFIEALSTIFADCLLGHATKTSRLPHASTNQDSPSVADSNPLPVIIGHDVRTGSIAIAKQFAETFSQRGLKVIWLGLVTTPLMAYWAEQYEGHGFIATASHSDKDTNGIKWLIDGKSPSHKDIQHLYEKLHNSQLVAVNDSINGRKPAGITYLSKQQIQNGYTSTINKAVKQLRSTHTPSFTNDEAYPSRPLTLVIDCMNGATGGYAKEFFKSFPMLCTIKAVLNETADSNFSKGNPDPTEANRLNELETAVITYKADIGLAFDGDGDRLMIVDHTGQTLAPDDLLYLLARVAIEESSITGNNKNSVTTQYNSLENKTKSVTSPSVLFDVKCSHHLPKLITKLGATPIMGKTGSSHMRRTLKHQNASQSTRTVFAGELSGHFLFNDGLFILHDDAMYAAIRLINWLTKQPQSIYDLINQLPNMVSTADVYLPLTFANPPKTVDLKNDGIGNDANSIFNSNMSSNIDSLNTSTAHVITNNDCNNTDIEYRTVISRLFQLIDRLQHSRPIMDTQSKPKKLNPTSDESLPQHQYIPIKTQQWGLPKHTLLTNIDGLRLDFSNGFGVIRPSNTSHSLTVRFAGNTVTDLQEVQRYFVTLCQTVSSELAAQIADIKLTF